MNTKPRRIPTAMLLAAGVLSLAGWTILASYYRHGRIHVIAIIAMIITLAMMFTTMRTRRAPAGNSDAILILSLTSLALGILAMLFVIL